MLLDAATREMVDSFVRAHAAAHRAATSPFSGLKPPTEAQLRGNRYRLGRMEWAGLTLLFENAAGTVREGTSDGVSWRNVMKAHYGGIEGTRGADGDPVDVFLGPMPEARTVWVINQRTPAGDFDEHKVLAGFPDVRSALDAYRLSYAPGWDRFGAPVRLTLDQLRWWLRYADTSIELTPDLLPPEPDMTEPAPLNRVLWDSADNPLSGLTLDAVLYRIRGNDAADGLVFDPMTFGDLTEGCEVVRLDSLLVEVGRLLPKMNAMLRMMSMAGDGLDALSVQITDPVRRFGGVHVAALFELSDGQTITVWFHNPDSTPTKLTPTDTLVSWKWQLNKKDITIVVAPESGQDLNMRDVARRVMRLAAKNSAAFQRMNGKRAERMARIQDLKDTLTAKQGELAGLLHQIEVATVAKADREAQAAKGPAWKQPDAEPTGDNTAEDSDRYWRIRNAGEEALLYWQDALDSLFGSRMVAVRNALRALGWEGEQGGVLSFDGVKLEPHPEWMGAGRNVTGVVYFLKGDIANSAQSKHDGIRDDLSASPEQIAAMLHADAQTAENIRRREAEEAWNAELLKVLEARGIDKFAFTSGNSTAIVSMHEAGRTPAEVVDALQKAAPILPGTTDYVEWEDALTRLVEERMEVDRGDAQGMVEAKDMIERGILRSLFGEGYTAERAYQRLFGDENPVADDEEVKPPTPTPPFYVMLGDQSVSEHADLEEAAAAAKVVADTDPFAHEGVWVADADGNSVRDIRAAGLAPEPVAPAEAEFLRKVKAGAMDALPLGELFGQIEAAVQKLADAGLLVGDVDADAAEALKRWVELDEKANG